MDRLEEVPQTSQMKPPARREPQLPARWSYSASVRRMKATVWKWKRITAAMLHELWVAHEILTHQGAVSNVTKSWEEYCDAIGLSRMTAWRWLKQYDPVAGKLIEAPKATPNVPALRPAVTLPMRQIRHGLATGLRRLAQWIDAR